MPTANHIPKRQKLDSKDPLAVEQETNHAALLEQQKLERRDLEQKHQKEMTEMEAKHKEENREFIENCKKERAASATTDACGYCGTRIENGTASSTKKEDMPSTCCQCRVTRKCSDCKWTTECGLYGPEHGFCSFCAAKVSLCESCGGCGICQDDDAGCCKWNQMQKYES